MDATPRLALRRLLAPRPAPRPGEQCELCGAAVGEEHQHVVSVETRALLCACRACYLLFTHEGAAQGRYRAVPERYAAAADFRLKEGQWEALQIPVGIAFFFFNSSLGRTVAFYPSPAGATESLLSLDTWDKVRRENPVLDSLAPDVEALLVYKRPDGFECHLVPIDACYELVGHLRRLWRGFDGGREAHDALETFFANVRARARPVSERGAKP